MLNLKELLKNRIIKYSLIGILVVLLGYIFIRLIFYPSDSLLPIFEPVIDKYLFVVERVANLCFRILNSEMRLSNHEFVFLKPESEYQISFVEYIKSKENWLLSLFVYYKKWSAIILFMIWAILSPIGKKSSYSLIFLIFHFISLVGALFFLGVVFPRTIDDQTVFIRPYLVGTSFMFVFISLWVKLNQGDLNKTLKKLNIGVSLSKQMFNEIIIVLLLLLILAEYIIPIYNFKSYINFLLEITKWITSLFGFDGTIDGSVLIGENVPMYVSKVCLGLKTMFIFASLVFLTRPKHFFKTTFIFLLSGAAFLFILNIIRLVLLFVIAQGENGLERALYHHEVYNALIYVSILIMWVIWYEFFVRKTGETQ